MPKGYKANFEDANLFHYTKFKKNNETFSIIKVWEKCVVILDKEPTSNNITKDRINVEVVHFIEGSENYKKEIVFETNLSKDRKKLEKIYSQSQFWKFDELGWEEVETGYYAKEIGSLTKIPIHKLSLCANEIEILQLKLTKDQFEKFKNSGMPESFFNEEFEDAVEMSAPVFNSNLNLEIDNKEIESFSKKIEKKYLQAKSSKEPGKNSEADSVDQIFVAAGARHIKRSFYEIDIFEDFSIDKISINVFYENILGADDEYEFIELFYDGKSFQFTGNSGSNSDDYWLASSEGEVFSFDIVEDEFEEDEEGEEEDDEENED